MKNRILSWGYEDHPRIRGEHSNPQDRTGGEIGSSPHTRGARNLAIPGVPERRIIPAYAGSTPLFISPQIV